MKMHMLAAISRLYEPGKKYDIMLCLVGGQGTGKSTFFKYLAIQDEWFTDDVKRLDDKKVYEYLQGHWIVEMSEMNAVANAKSIEETKSFLSRQKDTYRIPYERRAEDRYRQCVFCGTSNDLAFLPFDRTGNRLGYGGGFYDTYLAAHPQAGRAAIAFAMQIAEDIPSAPHDIRPDIIVTEKEMIQCIQDSRETR